MLPLAPEIQRRMAEPAPIKWLFAGDSITHGGLHTMGWRDYTELFSERLRYELGRFRDCVIKTGVSGWRIGNIEADFDWSVAQYQADVVSIAVGMNDCTKGESGVDGFLSSYRRVIQRLRETAPATILILHTPPRILALDEVRQQHLPHYVEAIRLLANEVNALLVDHHAAWAPLEEQARLQFFLSNAIHPNEHGHRLMAKVLLKRLELWSPDSNVGRLFMPCHV